MTFENKQKITRFYLRYRNQQVWQIETQIKELINELVKDEVARERTNIGWTILNGANRE